MKGRGPTRDRRALLISFGVTVLGGGQKAPHQQGAAQKSGTVG